MQVYKYKYYFAFNFFSNLNVDVHVPLGNNFPIIPEYSRIF